ncbi:MAG: hypothetical protein IT376_21185 [Polyangiaceae bacterium]|nr:hypothetical protein [Polyangiaceae bacterium]
MARLGRFVGFFLWGVASGGGAVACATGADIQPVGGARADAGHDAARAGAGGAGGIDGAAADAAPEAAGGGDAATGGGSGSGGASGSGATSGTGGDASGGVSGGGSADAAPDAPDPCVGVPCASPPAAACQDSTHLLVFDPVGTCSGGSCLYTSRTVDCGFGCVAGVCSGDPCAGVSCDTPPASACATPTTRRTYASVGSCSGGSCTYAPTDTPCPYGCAAGACQSCTLDADCGVGRWCDAGACAPCASDARCGASCAACGGSTPHCLDQGGTASCVQCRTTADCAAGTCDAAHACATPTCTPPASACASGGSQDGGCGNPYRISRTEAGAAGGFTVAGTWGLCGRNDQFNGGCDTRAGGDAEYRVFARAGETLDVSLARGSSTCTIGWSGTISLRIYQDACADCGACPAPTCATQAYCTIANSQTPSWVAPADGWYTLVVDSNGPAEDKGGVFTLNVKLTCAGACGC